ncbi:MAG: hypothetical protein ACP5I3_02490 [Thermoproteus sp.]
MRLYMAASLAVAIYLFYALHVNSVGAALSVIEASLILGFGLIASLAPAAGPALYAEIMALAQSATGVALPPMLYVVLTWLSFALSGMSTAFLAMYLLQMGRWAAKRAFRFLLYW